MNTAFLKRIPKPLLLPAGLILLALTGCTVGPNYVRPQVPAPPAYRGADDAPVSSANENSLGDENWAKVFNEPELQELIRTALANNYNVRIAAQHVLEAQAQLRITRSQQFPTVSIGGTGVGADLGSSIGKGLPSGTIAAGSFNVSAAWNPDFWGLYRRQTEAQRAQIAGMGAARRPHDAGSASGHSILSVARL